MSLDTSPPGRRIRKGPLTPLNTPLADEVLDAHGSGQRWACRHRRRRMIAAFIAACPISRQLFTVLNEKSCSWRGAPAGHGPLSILAFILSPARTLRNPRDLLTTLHAQAFHSRGAAEAAAALLRAWPDRAPVMIGDVSGVDFMPGHAYVMARRLGCMLEDNRFFSQRSQ